MTDAAMIFAAGFGTRMGDLTQNRPKPMIRVSGAPMIEHALAHAKAANMSRVVVNTHYLGNQIAAHLAGRGVDISHEHPDILDTGGGLKQALPILARDEVITLNSDTIWTGANPVETLRAGWDPTQMGALLLLVPRNRAQMYRGAGDFDLSTDGQVTRRAGNTAEFVYTGAQMINARVLANHCGAFSLNIVWDRLIRSGRVSGAIHPGGFVDVGRPECIPVAEAELAAHV